MQLRLVAVRTSFPASWLSGLFEVWLAVPGSGAASLAGLVSMRFVFAAVLLPATFTSVLPRVTPAPFPFHYSLGLSSLLSYRLCAVLD